MCRPLSCMYHCREIERESNPTSRWFSHWNVYNEADIFASAVSSVLMNPHTEIWKTRVNRPCKSSKIQNAVHLRLQQSKVLELSCHKWLFKKNKITNCPPTNRDTISSNLPPNPLSGTNSLAYRLFIPALLSSAPVRWVTSNQPPSNV